MKLIHPQISILPLVVSILFASVFSLAAAPQFENSFVKAKQKAKAEDKPLIVIFSADWCPPCKIMKRIVYPSPEVKPFHDQFIWAYLDADQAENQTLMLQYAVQGIPHIAVHKADGSVFTQLRGALGPDQLALELSKVTPPAE